MNHLLDGSQVNLLFALLGGFVTFFASCLLPLVPTYLAYLSGVSLASNKASKQRWLIFRSALSFVTGFIIIFIILGLAINRFAVALAKWRPVIERAGGAFFIILGLFMLGLFKNSALNKERKLNVQGFFEGKRQLHAFITGVAFGFGWTPCIGPVLAVILFWSASQETLAQGILMLTSYGIGLGIPFLLVALGFEKIMPLLKKSRRITRYTSHASGIFMVLAGALMISGNFQKLSLFLLNAFHLNTLAI